MGRRPAEPNFLSRRQFLRQLGYTSPILVPAPFELRPWRAGLLRSFAARSAPPGPALSEVRLKPDYPSPSPLDAVLRLAEPGTDAYVAEKYAAELQNEFLRFERAILRPGGPGAAGLAGFLHGSLLATVLSSAKEQRKGFPGRIELRNVSYNPDSPATRDTFAAELARYFASLGRLRLAQFEIVGIRIRETEPLEADLEVCYTLVGTPAGGGVEQRAGRWRMSWRRAANPGWLATQWNFLGESRSSAAAPLFADCTAKAVGETESYQRQLSSGVDDWRAVLDGACGIDVYGNNGIAAGDFNGDGRDGIYVCQPAGLPNRLYRNRGDGTFEDVTEQSGLGVLDATACALFADFNNKGAQDLLVVTAAGPLLFENQGNCRFTHRPEAFRFAK